MPYRFEGFLLDPDRGLSRSGKAVALEPLSLELLRYLVENAGRVVGRDELNARLWDGRVVSDAALSTQVRSVRRALGDDRAQQRFIRTHPRRGFSFVAPVERVDGAPAAPVAAPAPGGWRRVLPWAAVAGVVLVLLGTVGVLTRPEAPATGAPAVPALSIAVLPFDNLSGDAANDYLADAFTEDLVTDLSRIRDAFVISRSTTFTYRGRAVDAAAVARDLGVRYVLEGSVRIEGDRARINAQLIDGATNGHLWSDRYDRPLDRLFDLQDNVTGRIASVLRAELRMAENARQAPDLGEDAWDLALRGNVILYNHQGVADYRQAHALLAQSVSLDPSISSAWAGLAFVHYIASVASVPGVSAPDSAGRSLEAALRAVEADPMNAEPYWLVGAGYARLGQPERGMAACETAMDLNPNMDCGHVCAGLVKMALDEPGEAVPYFQHALRLNPRFRPFTKEKYLGIAYIQSGRDGLAIRALNRALAKAPEDTLATLALAAALVLDGRRAEAEETLARFRRESGRAPPSLSSLRAMLGWLGPGTERMLSALDDLGVAES